MSPVVVTGGTMAMTDPRSFPLKIRDFMRFYVTEV
jgi:hypothetical protein